MNRRAPSSHLARAREGRRAQRAGALLLAVALGAFETGCDASAAGGPGAAQSVAVSVTPEVLALAVNSTATFEAVVTGTMNNSLMWSIQEGAAGGNISSTGVYTAPSSEGTFHLTATSVASPSASSTATVTVTSAAPSTALLYPPPTTMSKLVQPALAEPALGASVLYADLGTTVTHATNRIHHYAKTPVWNSNETLALVGPSPEVYTASVRYLIDGATYRDLRDLVAGQAAWPNEHRTWSNTNPNHIYGVNSNALQWIRIDVSTNPATATVLRTFTATDFGLGALTNVSYGNYEGNLDDNDTGAVILGKATTTPDDYRAAVLINPKTGNIRCRITGGGSFGNVMNDATMSHDGRYVIVAYGPGGGPLDVYNASDCSYARRISSITGHYDACVSTAGDQVVVQEGSTSSAVTMTRLSDGTATVVYGPDAYNLHVSCRNVKRPGWVYLSLSNYRCSSGSSAYAGTMIYNRVIAVKLDGSKLVESFAWDHQPCPATEAEVTMACPSPSGTRVWWKTNWNGTSSGTHSFVAQQR